MRVSPGGRDVHRGREALGNARRAAQIARVRLTRTSSTLAVQLTPSDHDSATAASATSAARTPAEHALRQLDPRVVLLWRMGWLMRTLFLSAAAAVSLVWLELPLPSPAIVAGIFVLGLAMTLAWPPLQYRHWGFAVRQNDVFVRHGVLWRTTSVVPHGRIQHVDTQQGPLERAVGLSSVVMFTAGTVGATLAIAGLSQADAESLRERLAQLSGSDDAV